MRIFKVIKVIVISILLSCGFLLNVNACEIIFKVISEEKKEYKEGDEIIFSIEVKLTHRVCPIAMQDTKFTYDGIKVIGATKWEETKPGIWTRKIKSQVINNGKTTIMLSAQRKCEKDGGFSTIQLNK